MSHGSEGQNYYLQNDLLGLILKDMDLHCDYTIC